ncbi:MAG: enoyl-CoA hydratase/isomerase family protein [Okeania sp. SIO2D1]|nr:enoyl-CoA hydratase/isomerase family protein [Okeania sp. SIO2D1]
MTLLSGTVQMSRVGKLSNIVLFTLDRPEKANAYHNDMVKQFAEQLEEVIDDPSISVGIVTGAGKKVFCAGADRSNLSDRSYEDGLNLKSRQLFDRWASTPWPTIAAMEGPAIAGGLELALACDFRICSPESWFSLPEVDLGLIPAAGGIRRLTKLVNEGRAKAMILFGQKVDSATALEWGLVSQISDQVLDDAISLAEIVAQRDVLATRLAKITLHSVNASGGDASLEAVSQALLYHRRNSIQFEPDGEGQ